MPTTASINSKVCIHCGRDVTGAQRMRDSQGKYWCIACGESDKRKKKGDEGVVCAGCSKTFAPAQMTAVNLLPYCSKCAKRRRKSTRSGESLFARLTASSDQIDKKRLVMMLAFMGLLAIVAAVVHFAM
jgi:formylmethanofuran dehydrogenase subunit E